MSELKFCPFCGSEAYSRVKVIEFSSHGSGVIELVVQCEVCGVHKRSVLQISDTDFSKVYEAMTGIVDDWNRRIDNSG